MCQLQVAPNVQHWQLPSPCLSLVLRSQTNPQVLLPLGHLPLREVAGVDGLVRVHVPFSLSELPQIGKRLGSYTSNSSAFIKEFKFITQSYSLIFHDIHMILTNNLLPEECRLVWEQERTHADEIHQTDKA